MCLIGLAWKAHPEFPLIVAANRDEFHARATASSAWWPETSLLAGRDLAAGGTWMGVTRGGRFAALTNYRDPGEFRPAAPSRGALVANFLLGGTSPEQQLAGIAQKATDYNGFNLLAGTGDALWYYGNRGTPPRALAPGIYGLSNALLDTPWPKVTGLKTALAAVLGQVPGQDPLPSTTSSMLPGLFAALGDTAPAADAALPRTGLTIERERLLSAPTILSDTYGTRASTVLIIARDGRALWEERSLTPTGAVAQVVREEFRLED